MNDGITWLMTVNPQAIRNSDIDNEDRSSKKSRDHILLTQDIRTSHASRRNGK